jgi:hypothetical protein
MKTKETEQHLIREKLEIKQQLKFSLCTFAFQQLTFILVEEGRDNDDDDDDDESY